VFTIDGIRQFHRWTHLCLNVALDHLSTLPESAYVEQVPNFGFPTLRDQVIHIFNCEGFWIHVLQGTVWVDRHSLQYPAITDTRRLKQEVTTQTLAYFSSLTNEKLNANTELHFPDGDVAVRTPVLVIHHFLTHAFHHKGQIVAMCRALGHPAPDTDLNHFE
jgi:uncharacterized damage-inducible protein DinB